MLKMLKMLMFFCLIISPPFFEGGDFKKNINIFNIFNISRESFAFENFNIFNISPVLSTFLQ